MVGGVGRPGPIDLPDSPPMTVLGAIAQAGGPAAQVENPQVRLIRGDRSFATPLKALVEAPARDVILRPGDKLVVEEDERFFIALGATGTERVVPFTRPRLTALEAMALAGGVSDTRGNPAGVLVLRDYGAAAASASGPATPRVIFALDLTTPDGLFSAGQFEVLSRDLVLVTESPVARTRTVLDLLGAGLGIGRSIDSF